MRLQGQTGRLGGGRNANWLVGRKFRAKPLVLETKKDKASRTVRRQNWVLKWTG